MIENIESDFFFFMSNHKQKNNIHVTIPYNLRFQQDELYKFFFSTKEETGHYNLSSIEF
jgi:translation initiation factor 2 beta subunit (eIF-2beta)/eIF-5